MIERQKIRKAAQKAIKNILLEGTTDVPVFNRLFEIELLKDPRIERELVDTITKDIYDNNFETLPIKLYDKLLVPKKNVAEFRFVAFLDLYESIIYLTLAILLAGSIEKERIPLQKNKVFSYRYLLQNNNNGILFNSKYNYTAFKKQTSLNSKKRGNNITVHFDISNFYDRLNLHRLNSQLLSIASLDKHTEIISLLDSLLLYWSARDSYGLPVGSNASRILAEAALMGVDTFLDTNNIKFVRYVDDYRIFTTDLATAYKYMNLISSRLQKEGLFINSAKIRFVDNKKIEQIQLPLFDILEDATDQLPEDVTDQLPEDVTDQLPEDADESKYYIDFWKKVNLYAGTIPLKFRNMSNAELVKYQGINIEKNLSDLKKNNLPDSKDTMTMFRILIANNYWDYLITIATYIFSREPHFIPVFCDILSQKKEMIFPEYQENMQEILRLSTAYIKEINNPEYIKVYLTRLIGDYSELFEGNIIELFMNVYTSFPSYLLRAILEVTYDNFLPLSRNDTLLLREIFKRANIFEKRAIIGILKKSLRKEELNAFLKNVRFSESDYLLQKISKNIK